MSSGVIYEESYDELRPAQVRRKFTSPSLLHGP